MSASEILKRERERKRERRRQRVAEARRRALAAAKESGIRRILRLPEVEAATGKKRSAIYEEVADGTFPAPVPIGLRAVGWIESEILGWQEACMAARDASKPTEHSGSELVRSGVSTPGGQAEEYGRSRREAKRAEEHAMTASPSGRRISARTTSPARPSSLGRAFLDSAE